MPGTILLWIFWDFLLIIKSPFKLFFNYLLLKMDRYHHFSLPFEKILVLEISLALNSSQQLIESFSPTWHSPAHGSSPGQPPAARATFPGQWWCKSAVRKQIPGQYLADRSSSGLWLTSRDWSAVCSQTVRLQHFQASNDLKLSTVVMKYRLVTFFLSFLLHKHGQI